MAIDPDLERRLAARLRAELEREAGPRPTWAGPPVAPSRPRRWAPARGLASAAAIAIVALLGAIVAVRAPSSATVTPLATTATSTASTAASSAAASERPSVPPGSFDLLLDGRAMRGDGWRLLAATLRTQGVPTPGPSAAGTIWAVSDPSIMPKIWIALGRENDPPAVDTATEVVVAIDTAVSTGPVCGRVVVDGVSFDATNHLVTLQYEDASDAIPLPAASEGLPTATPTACPAVANPALLVFALDRTHVPPGPISILAVRGRGQLAATSEARALLVLPPSPSGPAAEPILRAGFSTATFGWVETATRLLVTADGGVTWRDATPPTSMGGGAPDGVSFRDGSVGWLIHNDGPAGGGSYGAKLTLWRTRDGGRTWSSSRMPTSGQGFDILGVARIVWIDADHVVVDFEGGMGNGYADDIVTTADGGQTWLGSTSYGEGVTGVPAFADPRTGFLVGGAGGDRLYATHDGGRTWRQVPVTLRPGGGEPAGPPTLADARFFSSTTGLLVGVIDTPSGSISVVYRTTDAGRTWASVSVATEPATTCSLLSADAWTCLSATWIDTWTQGGLAVSDGPVTGLPPSADPHLVNATHGWATAGMDDPGALYLTSDGGATWQRVIPGA